MGEAEEIVDRRSRELGWTFPVLLDSRGEISSRYGITGHPETFLIDKQGRIAAMAIGPRNWQSPEAERLITALVKEDQPF